MQTEEDIAAQVSRSLEGILQRPVKVTEQTNIVRDLGLDSIAVMDFVMDLEDKLDVSVPLDRIAEVETVGDLIRTIGELKGPLRA